MNWLLSCPVWGDQYIETFKVATLPALNAALKDIAGPVRFVIHTDNPAAFIGAPFKGSVRFLPVPVEKCLYTTFGNCHREILEIADDGECIAFLTADIVVSKECFVNAERRFDSGKRAIVVTAARTLATPIECPIGATSRDLLEWSFTHLHPVTQGCYWGVGRNPVTWAMYFEGQSGTVLRAFHLHPAFVVNDRPLYFDRTTVDLDLLERYSHEEIHVVVDPSEMSFAEISGLDKSLPQGIPLCVDSVVAWARHHTTPMHRHLFTHRIVVRGTGDDHLDEEPAREILGILG